MYDTGRGNLGNGNALRIMMHTRSLLPKEAIITRVAFSRGVLQVSLIRQQYEDRRRRMILNTVKLYQLFDQFVFDVFVIFVFRVGFKAVFKSSMS